MTINLADFNDSPYLVSDEFAVGTVFPPMEISSIEGAEVPVPNSKKTNRKIVVFFKGAKKGWCANKTELRRLGKIFGATKSIEKAWIGGRVSLHIVGDVRRPDGSKGNAIRVKEAWPPTRAAAPAAEPGVPATADAAATTEPTAATETA